MTAFSDSELLGKIKQQDAEAFSTLYDRYASRLYGLALKILTNPSLAEDVIQEVFLTVWEKAEQFERMRGGALAWLMALCRNRSIDKLRAQERSRKKITPMPDDLEKLPSLDGEMIFAKIGVEEGVRAITQAMQQVPDDQRQLIEMAYFREMSQSEIARETQLPLGTVKTRIRSGMKKVRELMHAFQESA